MRKTLDLKYNWSAALTVMPFGCRPQESQEENGYFFGGTADRDLGLLIKDPIALFSAEWLADEIRYGRGDS